MHLMGVYLMGVHLTGVHLVGVYLMGVHLIGVHLTGVHLVGVHLTGVSWASHGLQILHLQMVVDLLRSLGCGVVPIACRTRRAE